MPPRSVEVARALGPLRRTLAEARARIGATGATGTIGVLVAVSGGADSMALFGLLDRVARADALRLVIGHVDHGLRASARAEAELVMASARARGHAHACARLSIAAGPGLPARARELRRAALLELAEQHGAQLVALGHTATDQAETVLLHLCRGAGPEGLAAMAPVEPWTSKQHGGSRRLAPGSWTRPLLHLTRDETRALALQLGLPFVDDPGNDAIEHPRVRIRHRVLAELRELNPQVELRIAAAARSLRLEHERDGAAASPLPTTIDDEGCPALDATVLRSLSSGTRRRLVRALCIDGGVPVDALPERTVAAIDDALARGLARRRWDLHRHRLHLGGGRLWLARAVLATSEAEDPFEISGIVASGPVPKRPNH